jgi:hypothetical protein
MYDIGIGFVPLILFSILEETDLTGFAELNLGRYTCFRLLLRFQLSSPRLENWSFWVYREEEICARGIGVLSIVVYGNEEGFESNF